MAERSMKRPRSGEPLGFRSWRQKTQEQFLRKTLKKHGGNVTHTAKALGVHRSTLQRLLRRHNLPAA